MFRLPVCLFVPMLTAICLLAQTPPPKEVTPEQKDLLKAARNWADETTALRKAGKLDEAIAAAEKMLAAEIKIHGERHDDPIGSLRQIASMQAELGRFEQASRTRLKVLEIEESRSPPSPWRVADARHALDDVAILRSLSPEQRNRLRQAGAEQKRLLPLLRNGSPTAAAEFAEKVTRARSDLLGEDHPDTIAGLEALAIVYHSSGFYPRALPLYEKVLEARAKRSGLRHPGYASALNNLAFLYKSWGNYPESLALNRKVLALRQEILGEGHPDWAASADNLAFLYTLMGEYSRAEGLFRRSLQLRREALGTGHRDYAQSLNNLAALYRSMGEYAKAEPLQVEGMEIQKRSGGEAGPDYIRSAVNLAALYRLMGDYPKAEALYLRAGALAKTLYGPNHPIYANHLNDLGTMYQAMRDFARAKPLLLEAWDLRMKANRDIHPDNAESMNNVADLYMATGEYAKAEPLLTRAMRLRGDLLGEDHPDYARSMSRLAVLYAAMGSPAKAEPLFVKSLEIRRKALGTGHPDYALGLSNLGSFHADRGQLAKAEPLLVRAVEIIAAQRERTAEIQTEASQLAYAGATREFIDDLLRGTVGSDPAKVYEPLSRLRGAVASRQTFARASRQTKPEVVPLVEELRKVSAEMSRLVNIPSWSGADLPKRLDELAIRYEQLQKELAQKSDAFAGYQKRKRVTPADIRDALPEGSVLIDFLVYGDRLCAFVLARESIRRVELGELAPIAAASGRFRETLNRATPLTGRPDDPALVLRDGLWKPLAGAVGDAKLVLICPDGPLCRLPFAALPGTDNAKYLIEERAVAVIPVPQQLFDLAEPVPQPSRPSMLLVGGVRYDADPGAVRADGQVASRSGSRGKDRAGWKYLPGTEKEIDTIGGLFKTHRTGTLTELRGGAATETAFEAQAPGHAYLHLATHGFFSPPEVRSGVGPVARTGGDLTGGPASRPAGPHPGLLSGVVFAGANRPDRPGLDDGIQTALEVEELDLTGVRLAVLSACETGLGQTAGGEGVLGLQRALQLAGARTTVTTLWQIPDEASQVMMARFYANLWGKKLGTLESLREAQRWMIGEGWKDERVRGGVRGVGRADLDEKEIDKSGRMPPFFWAAFVLSGDWR